MIPEEGYYQPEVIPWNGGHQLTEELAFMKKKVLPLLLTNALSGPFKLPVNAKAEGIYPDYFKVGRGCKIIGHLLGFMGAKTISGKIFKDFLEERLKLQKYLTEIQEGNMLPLTLI